MLFGPSIARIRKEGYFISFNDEVGSWLHVEKDYRGSQSKFGNSNHWQRQHPPGRLDASSGALRVLYDRRRLRSGFR
jgi:hypothetical protein